MGQESSLGSGPCAQTQKGSVWRNNAQLPVHATGPCVVLLLLSHFVLSQLPLQPLLLSVYASVDHPCIPHIFLKVCYCIPL